MSKQEAYQRAIQQERKDQLRIATEEIDRFLGNESKTPKIRQKDITVKGNDFIYNLSKHVAIVWTANDKTPFYGQLYYLSRQPRTWFTPEYRVPVYYLSQLEELAARQRKEQTQASSILGIVVIISVIAFWATIVLCTASLVTVIATCLLWLVIGTLALSACLSLYRNQTQLFAS